METIFDILKSWPGAVEIDGRILDDSTGALTGALNAKRIILYANNKNATESKSERPESVSSNEYLITVKSYMTKKSSPGFDFMAQWNNDNPMPLITMVGTIEKETPGMVYMKLRGELVSTVTWEGWVIRSAIIAKQPYPCV